MTQLKDIWFQEEVITQWEFRKTIVTVGFTEADYICDGVADNVQIQEAIDAVTTDWGTIIIKKGIYNFLNNIQLKSNVRIIGEWAGTILKAGSAHGGVFYQGSSIVSVNASIENLVLDANNIVNVSGIQIYKFNGLTIKDVIVKNVNSMWWIKLWDYGVDPVVAKSYNLILDWVRVENVYNTTYEPIITVNTNNITLSNTTVTGCDLTNASLVSIFLLSKDVKITGCHFDSATDDYGLLDITGAENITVVGNTFTHTGTTGNNAIVNRNTKNVIIDWNTITGKTMSGAGGAGAIMLDWSGTIDGHTNPFPYTENITFSNNIINWFYYGLNFSNADASTNCGWKNINIIGNTIQWFDYSWITSRHVSGRNSSVWNINWNIITPRSAWDKSLVWMRNGWFAPTKLVIDWNTLTPTTSNNTTCFQFDGWDTIKFGTNHVEALWTGVRYSMGTSTNVEYSIPAIGCAVYSSVNLTSAATATWTTFNWDSEIFDTSDIHSTSTNTSRLTVKVPWKQKVGFSAYFSVRDAGSEVHVRIAKNGWASYIAKQVINNPNASNNKYVALTFHWFDSAVVWDYYEIQMYSSSGTANVLIGWGIQDSRFDLQLVWI